MKTSRVRYAQAFRSIATLTLFLFAAAPFISCASGGSKESTDLKPVEIPDELSLRADRSALDEARKDISEEKRRDNDEVAAILQLMNSKGDQQPGEIRDRFNKALRDRRERNDKSLRKRREDFTKVERRGRDAFLGKAKEERESFTKDKHTADERKRFFDDQDQSRRDYFASEADKRKDFESELTEARKTFEDYAKEKTDQFNQESRAYSTDYYERKKQENLRDRAKEKTRTMNREPVQPNSRAGQTDEKDEFSAIPPGPGIQLGPPTGH